MNIVELIIDILIYLVLGGLMAYDFRKLGSSWPVTVIIFLFYPVIIIFSLLVFLFDLARMKLKRK